MQLRACGARPCARLHRHLRCTSNLHTGPAHLNSLPQHPHTSNSIDHPLDPSTWVEGQHSPSPTSLQSDPAHHADDGAAAHSRIDSPHRAPLDDHRSSPRPRGLLQKSTVATTLYECLRISPDGSASTVYLRRRDLLRHFMLDPRDLRRIDPHLRFTRSSPTMYVTEDVLLVQLSGIRLIIAADTALLLDPHCGTARQFVSQICQKLRVSSGQALLDQIAVGRSADDVHLHWDPVPFELDVLDVALQVSISQLDSELVRAQEQVQLCLTRLPRDITPQNLDDLRRAKSTLVELESRADAYRELLEGIMDDDNELREFNLSSRVVREARRIRREVQRIEREIENEKRERGDRGGGAGEAVEGAAAAAAPDGLDGVEGPGPGAKAVPGLEPGSLEEVQLRVVDGALQRQLSQGQDSAVPPTDRSGDGGSASREGTGGLGEVSGVHMNGSRANTKGHGSGGKPGTAGPKGRGLTRGRRQAMIRRLALTKQQVLQSIRERYASHHAQSRRWRDDGSEEGEGSTEEEGEEGAGSGSRGEELPYGDVGEETDAMQEMRQLLDAEEEELELQEVEELLEYYLQRATGIQTESERLLAGARDLEESIGLALSARRFEVQRLELQLSIGSFAAAIGAALAGIFGMNLRSKMEESVIGFWGITAAIIIGCIWVYRCIYQWTKDRKILV